MGLRDNKILLGSLLLIATSIAYYLLIYLPKQQEMKLRQEETNLRKQTYELCQKWFDDTYEAAGDAVAKEVAQKRLTTYMMEQEWKQEMADKLMPILNNKDQLINNCVEKKINEYKK